MSNTIASIVDARALIHSNAQFIKGIQRPDGAIPWFADGKLDPWDHCEAIMALTINREYTHANQAFAWLAKNQNVNGSWYAQYFGAQETNDHHKIETNFVAYPATCLWHLYCCSRNKNDVVTYFHVIEKAIDFIVSMQKDEGDIQWAISHKETLPSDALLTACSSILRSIECALNLAEIVNVQKPAWINAYEKLAIALTKKPWRFDRTWESKARFSMDWFYPILSGVYSKQENLARIKQSDTQFLVDGLGCKCVSDEPWITIAESCECVMALIASGEHARALALFNTLMRWQDDDGGFWTGYVYRDDAIWPDEKTSWTTAAVSLAADALFDLSPASKLFTSESSIYFAA